MTTVSAKFKDMRISFKHSMVICDVLRGMRLEKAKTLLTNLIHKKQSLSGKYYTNATKIFLEILENVEANAKSKNVSTGKLFIKKIKADEGYAFRRPRSRWRLRGRRVKSTNITIEVEER